MVSGLKINLRKCEIIPVDEVDNIDLLVQVLNWVGSLLTTYLGLPLGASNNDLSIWNLVLQRVKKRLSGRQKNYLSKGVKEVIIKSILLSIPT